jgi:hypothetical protein
MSVGFKDSEWEAYENLFLTWVLARPVGILLERVRVQHTPHVAATARVFVVVPCSANARGLFDDNEVVALVALDQVNGHAHAWLRLVYRYKTKKSARCLPDIPAPMITTAALVWSLFPTGTSGHGFVPPISNASFCSAGNQ